MSELYFEVCLQEVLERCLDEIDRLSKQLEDQERRMSSQHKDNTTVLKKQDGMAQHGFNPLKGYACDRKQEVKSNCKITMAAIVPPKR